MSQRHTLDGVAVDTVPVDMLLSSYGCFTTFVAVDASVLAWPRHRRRLVEGVRELWGHDLDVDDFSAMLRSHLAGESSAVSVRVSLYPARFVRDRPVETTGCRVLISSSAQTFPFEPEAGLAVRTVDASRNLAHLKSTNVLMQLMARRDAQVAGFDDAVFVDGERVLEGTTWSVLAWVDGRVVSPVGDVLESTTVAQMSRVAPGLGYELERRPLRLSELAAADAVLAANVHAPARAITRVDDTELAADADLLSAIATAFSALERDPI